MSAGLLLAPAVARAQAVQGCQPAQFQDRTTSNDEGRSLGWDFGITTAPERCMQVRVGQSVQWNGDFDNHPLAGSGGDAPNPISLHQSGKVTFNQAGTFGYVCLAHSPMKGAIKVVAATAPKATAAPAISPWLAGLLSFVLLSSGWLLLRARLARGTAA